MMSDASKDTGTGQPLRLRWYQFRLRSLLVLVTVGCVLLGTILPAWRRVECQRAAIAAIDLGPHQRSTRYDYEWDGTRAWDDRRDPKTGQWHSPPPPGPAWLREQIGVDWFADVVWARVSNDFQLRHVRAFPKLRWLEIGHATVTSADLEVLDGLTEMERLKFSGMKLDTNYRMSGPEIDDEGLKHLCELTKLQQLNVGGAPITDEGLKLLSHLTQLEQLRLGGTRVSGPGLRYIRGLDRLKELDLTYTAITDESLRYLEPFTELERLGLADTRITDDAVTYLPKLPKLKWLEASRTRITPAGYQKLRQALPALE